MGKKSQTIYELNKELDRVKGTNLMLEAWRKSWLASFANEDIRISMQTTMGALHQLWEKLRVEHQTAAVIRIEDMLASERSLKLNNQSDLLNRQQIASLSDEIRVLRLAVKGAEFQRDSAQKGTEDHGWTVVAKDRRIEELETGIRTALDGMTGNSEAHLDEFHDVLMALAKVLGDDHAEI